MAGGIKKRLLIFCILGVAALAIAAVVFFFFSWTKGTDKAEDFVKFDVVPVQGTVVAVSGSLSVQTLAGKTDVAADRSFTVDGFNAGRHLAFVKVS